MFRGVDFHGLDPLEGSEFDSWWTPDMMPEWEVKMNKARLERIVKQNATSSGGKPNFNLASEEEFPSLTTRKGVTEKKLLDVRSELNTILTDMSLLSFEIERDERSWVERDCLSAKKDFYWKLDLLEEKMERADKLMTSAREACEILGADSRYQALTSSVDDLIRKFKSSDVMRKFEGPP